MTPKQEAKQTADAIVAGFTPFQLKTYRRLKRNARPLGRVLVHSGNDGCYEWELTLILPCEADDPALLRGRTILYDPRPKLTAVPASAYEPLTQELIDEAARRKRRIELAGTPPIRLTVDERDGRNIAWENRTRRRKYPVFANVPPEGQPARIIR